MDENEMFKVRIIKLLSLPWRLQSTSGNLSTPRYAELGLAFQNIAVVKRLTSSSYEETCFR